MIGNYRDPTKFRFLLIISKLLRDDGCTYEVARIVQSLPDVNLQSLVIRQWHVKNALIFERYLGVQFVMAPVYSKTPKAIV